MKEHKIIETMLRRGFGIHSINNALSLKYANGSLQFCITSMPGFNDEPIFFEVHAREPKDIIAECQNYMDIILHMIRDQYWEDILYI